MAYTVAYPAAYPMASADIQWHSQQHTQWMSYSTAEIQRIKCSFLFLSDFIIMMASPYEKTTGNCCGTSLEFWQCMEFIQEMCTIY